MTSTVFTGPVLSGNVLQSDGTGNLAGLGGSAGTQNVGFCETVQGAAIAQPTSGSAASSTTIVIPANSFITGIELFISVGWSNSATLSIGTSATATELSGAIANASLVQGKYVVPVTSLIAAWTNSGATQDVQIYVKSSAAGVSTYGAATLIVKYLQSYNSFTNGQYT